MAALIEEAVRLGAFIDLGLLSSSAAAQIQFQIRLQTGPAWHRSGGQGQSEAETSSRTRARRFSPTCSTSTASPGSTKPTAFPFSGIATGKVLESFTPDFYLPEFDMHVELTT